MRFSEAQLGNTSEARKAAAKFRALDPELTMEAVVSGSEADRPDQHRIFEGARLVGLPVTDKELVLANAAPTGLLPH